MVLSNTCRRDGHDSLQMACPSFSPGSSRTRIHGSDLLSRRVTPDGRSSGAAGVLLELYFPCRFDLLACCLLCRSGSLLRHHGSSRGTYLPRMHGLLEASRRCSERPQKSTRSSISWTFESPMVRCSHCTRLFC